MLLRGLSCANFFNVPFLGDGGEYVCLMGGGEDGFSCIITCFNYVSRVTAAETS